jgi:septal ring factor EnvC (AmiA/AmiB activator)
MTAGRGRTALAGRVLAGCSLAGRVLAGCSLAGWPLALALALAVALAPAAARADTADAPETARAAAAALREATAALETAANGRETVEALTAAIRAYETGLAALRTALRRATIREAEIARRLEAEGDRLSALLGVLAGLEPEAGPLLLLHPAGPEGTVRAGMLLAEVTPALQAEVTALRADLAERAALRAVQAEAAAALGAGLGAAQQARTALSQASAARGALPRRLVESPEALAALAAGADSLDALAAGLAPAPQDAGAIVDFPAARGTLPLPVAGTVLRAPGEADAAGIRRPGLVLAAPAGALVTAPWAATLRYRGPLLDYGNVMLLEPAQGYLIVLAGLDAVYGAMGEVVPQGAALGLMGGTGAETGAAGAQTLYIEIRQDGAAIDPRPWFIETRE